MRASYPIEAPADAPTARFASRTRITRTVGYLCDVHRAALLLPSVIAPLRALVTQSAALPHSRERNAVLACWMVARLALPRLPRETDLSEPDALLLRAEATRRWLAGQALPLEVALAASRACDLAADKAPAPLADAIDGLRDAADALLSNAARAELTTLARLLRRSSLAAMR